MLVSFVNQKGGTGKSTGSVHMAHWLSARGSVLLVDSDAQQSSSTWLKRLNLPFRVISDPEELFEILPELSSQYDSVVVDGPGSLSEITKAILARCDLALVPCQPSGLDLHSSSKIVRFINHARELRGQSPKAALYLSRATKGTVLLRESREVFSDKMVPLLNSTVYQRQCIADAPAQGLTVFSMSGSPAKDAAHDFEELFTEALELIDG